MDLLGITRNPNQLRPFVRKCFSGIDDVTFALPNDDTPTNTLDYALHGNYENITILYNMTAKLTCKYLFNWPPVNIIFVLIYVDNE